MALYSPCISSEEASGGRVISGSLRFNESDSTSMTRTPGSAGNRKTWTHSCWLRKTDIANTGPYFLGGSDTNNYFKLTIGSDDKFYAMYNDGGTYNENFRSTQLFRDTSAWWHIVSVWDTTESSASDRVKIYVNGTEIDGTRTNDPALNYDGFVNNTVHHDIGRATYNAGEWFNGYISEINFVDGQALGPTYFGFSDPLTGIWRPKKFDINTTSAKVWGTCGFYLPFDGSGATVGTDQTGLTQNNWTLSNLSGSNVFYESPSGNAYGADPNSGITTTGFPTTYATLDFNAAEMDDCANKGEGGLRSQIGSQGSEDERPIGTMSFTSGKYYWEWEYISTTDSSPWCAVANPNTQWNTTSGTLYNYWSIRCSDNERTQVTNGSVVTQSALSGGNGTGWYGVAVDADNGKMWFSFEGTWQASGDPETGANPVWDTLLSAGTGELIPYWGTDGGSTTCEMRVNFGQSTFRHSCPKGFLPLCDANLPAPAVTRPFKYWEAIMYTGDDSAPDIRVRTTSGFSPDLVFMKSRTQTYGWYVFDSVRRGADDNSNPAPGMECYGQLYFDSTAVQANSGHNGLGLIKGGFNVDYQGQAIGEAGQGTNNMVSYSFKAGGYTNTFNVDDVGYASAAAAGLNGGTLTPTAASVGTKQGFSIIQYEGNSTADATISHGLGKTPAFTIIKNLDSTSGSWAAKHHLMSSTKQCFVDNNYAESLSSYGYIKDYSGTSTISFATNGSNWENTNATGDTLVAYIWAEIEGVSKFGKYVGNGNDSGPYVKLGFKPAILIIKCISHAESWNIFDNARDPDNYVHHYLGLDINTEENSTTTARRLDFYSDGFKLKGTNGTINTADYTYVYAAWAETPQHNLYGGIGNAR